MTTQLFLGGSRPRAQQLRQLGDVRRNPPRLVLSEQLARSRQCQLSLVAPGLTRWQILLSNKRARGKFWLD